MNNIYFSQPNVADRHYHYPFVVVHFLFVLLLFVLVNKPNYQSTHTMATENTCSFMICSNQKRNEAGVLQSTEIENGKWLTGLWPTSSFYAVSFIRAQREIDDDFSINIKNILRKFFVNALSFALICNEPSFDSSQEWWTFLLRACTLERQIHQSNV